MFVDTEPGPTHKVTVSSEEEKHHSVRRENLLLLACSTIPLEKLQQELALDAG